LIIRSLASGLICAALLAPAGGARPAGGDPPARGPFNLLVFNTPKAPNARAKAELMYAHSPFGIAVTPDGRALYDIKLTTSGLPEPSTLGRYTTYVAWASTPDLKQWAKLGKVTNGTTTVGSVEWNKFLFVVSAEASDTVSSETGPTVLHGTSPSGYLQTFLGHGLFRVPQPGG
jgi:hypothetical protein